MITGKKLTGFDNTVRSIFCYPNLATVDQGISNQSYLGAKLLSDRIDGKNCYKASFPACYRVSCGCLRQGDPYASITDN